MGFNFDKFTHRGSTYAPKISVRNTGAIGISQGALNRFQLMDGEFFFVLHYDKDARVIGMWPTHDAAEEGVLKLVRRKATSKSGKESVNAYVPARSFLDYYAIPFKKTKVYDAEWSDEYKMILVDLTKPRDAAKEDG